MKRAFVHPRDRAGTAASLSEADESAMEVRVWRGTDEDAAALAGMGGAISALPVVLEPRELIPDEAPPFEALVEERIVDWVDGGDYPTGSVARDQGEIWINRLEGAPQIWQPGTLNSGWVRLVEDGVEEPWVPDRQYLAGVIVTGDGRRWLALVDEYSLVGREPWNPVMWAVWQEVVE